MSEDFSGWVGKQEQAADRLEPARSNALRAALGHPAPLDAGAVLPPLHHWLYFWNVQPPAALGADGHPAKGGFLPPVPLPRRMWAGGRLEFVRPLHLGEAVSRTSTILSVEAKSGRSGDLIFVTVRHEIAGESGPAVIEEQDLVYRGAAAPGSIKAPSPHTPAITAAAHEVIAPDSVLLFRYSALTMNGHRIHYDRPYAMDEEAYPGLVVHGPLQATLLADLAARQGRTLKTFRFRGMSPAFDGTPLHVCGDYRDDGADVWTQQGETRCMEASATFG
ncbi:FAS1-like dehydratase domain-containing protein [Novosphingobium album (ex Liu et al. 2023)]|uniref:MaoC family dehydratase N-terminal domain-containing protein n=1 Tax=Novosphingobium album (ex Liu et al. 2023) TaxID=3031130 RepID=A0ABT5WTA2_9SPHN|nr:MaoC family dehydratase N-terminal domain-containing protein [Novosphingobium album (ex Liu et al. 2023)]MDE8652528.1 MaoC family dehydratase N-terminal domain-containing protein [Novosphingobium album (ex Liu et al. 2023)]